MVKQFLLIIGFLFSIQVMSQTGIGTTTPHASAKLDVSATNKGFLPPRVTLTSNTDVVTIPSPAEGLLVYNLGSVGLQAGYYYWNGANWATIATAALAGNAVVASDMVKLYSEAYSNASGKLSNASGFSFTVPVSGRYLFDFSSTTYGANATTTFKVRQGTTDLGTDVQTSLNNNVHVEYNGKVEVNLQSGITYNVALTTNATRDLYDYDRVYYKLVAGNLPVNQHMADRNIQLNNNYLSNDGGDEGIRVDNSGNVGIGTTTPGDLLVVGSSIALHDGGDKLVGMGWSPGSGKAILAGYPAEIRLNPSTGKLSLGTDPTSRSIGSSAGVQRRLTITSAGNVGIGTEDPTEKLEVIGNVKVTGKLNVEDPTGNVVTKVSRLVNRGVDVTLGNLKARIAATGNISLQLSTVSGTYSVYGSSVYSQVGVIGTTIDGSAPRAISTTPAYLNSSYSFGTAGATDTWIIMDTSNSIAWRITMILGSGTNNNLISIERLL